MTTATVEQAAGEPTSPAVGQLAQRVRGVAPTAALYAMSISTALILCGLLVSVTGGSARKVFAALLDGSVRSPGAWGLTLTTAAPLLVVAAGSIVASKAGMTNLGQEGQLLLGAAGTAYVATRLDAPGWILLPVSFACGALLAGIWVSLAAVMKFTRRVPEVMSTLLLGFIASQVTTFGLTKKWLLLQRAKSVSRTNNGDPLPANGRLPELHVFGNDISAGAVVAIVLTLVVAFVLGRTTTGFRLRMLGLNARTARRAGASAVVYGGTALVVSGVTAGLAGGLWLTGGAAGDRFTAAISSSIGWQGLLVALLARNKALLAIPMAFVFAALRTGSGFLAATGVNRTIADVVQAMLVLALLVPPAVQSLQRRHRNESAS